MRSAFRRPLLLAAASVIALGAGLPAQAQEAPPATVVGQAEPPPVIQTVPPADPLSVEDAGDSPSEPQSDEPGAPAPDQTEPEAEPDAGEETPKDPPIPAEWSPVPRDGAGTSAFGHYLVGRYALRTGHNDLASDALAKAYALTPEQPRLREQVFSTSLLSGEIERASRALPDEAGAPPFMAQAARLLRPVQAFADGDARTANALLKAAPIEAPHARAGLYLHPWIAAAAGDWDTALAQPPADLDVVSVLLMRANRAQLLEKRRQFDQAEAEWEELTSHAVASRLFRLPYGQFLERRGRRDEAIAQYEAAITAGSADRETYQALNRAKARGRAPAMPDWKAGAAQALITAAYQASAQEAYPFVLVYQRLAQALEPGDELAFKIGHTLRQAKLETQARTTLASISPSNPAVYAAARLQIAQIHQEDERFDDALAELQLAADAVPDDRSIAYMQASLLLQMKRYEEALVLLNGPLLNVEGQGFEIRFLRGAAYAWLDRQAEAEAELWAALQMQPDNPIVLNHLGYQWVDEGTRIEEGAAMIAKAHAANPEDGNIQDSLGWAQYRQGLFEEAVVTLEGAVSKEPANAEINDHLGDAYWAVGRQREAGFQWIRVLTLDVEPERRTEVEAKLKDKLGIAPPLSATPATGSGEAGH